MPKKKFQKKQIQNLIKLIINKKIKVAESILDFNYNANGMCIINAGGKKKLPQQRLKIIFMLLPINAHMQAE